MRVDFFIVWHKRWGMSIHYDVRKCEDDAEGVYYAY
jgi:hypothetical protein